MIAKVRAFLISLLHPTTSTDKICLEKEVRYKSVRVWSKDQAPLTLPRRHHLSVQPRRKRRPDGACQAKWGLYTHLLDAGLKAKLFIAV